MAWGNPRGEEVRCSLVKPKRAFLEQLPKQKIVALMSEFKSREWCGYLTGHEERGDFFIEDLIIPPHAKAGGAHAEAEPGYEPKNCIGFIHSHHSMGAFHSGTDQDYVDRNYPMSVTVARKGTNSGLEWDATSYVRTECGRRTTVEVLILVVPPKPIFDREDFLQEAIDNIKQASQGKVRPDKTDISNEVIYGSIPGRENPGNMHIDSSMPD